MGYGRRLIGALGRRIRRREHAPASTPVAESPFDAARWDDLGPIWVEIFSETRRRAEEEWSEIADGLADRIRNERGPEVADALRSVLERQIAPTLRALAPSVEDAEAVWREGTRAAQSSGDLERAIAPLRAFALARAQASGAAWRAACRSLPETAPLLGTDPAQRESLAQIGEELSADLREVTERFNDALGRLVAVEDLEDGLIEATRRWRDEASACVESQVGDLTDLVAWIVLAPH